MNSRSLLILGMLAVVAVLGLAVWTLLDDNTPMEDVATVGAPDETTITSQPPVMAQPTAEQPTALVQPTIAAGDAEPAPLPASTVFGSAVGRVVDKEGLPVANTAVVAFLSGPGTPFRTRRDLGLRTTTNGAGQFTFDALPVGSSCGVEVLPADFAPALKEPFDVAEDKTLDLGTIVVRPGVSVTGLITDTGSGTVLQNVLVSLHDITDNYRRGNTDAVPIATTRSNDKGRYSFSNLAMRQFQISVEHEGFIPLSSTLTFVLSLSGKPATQDFALERADHRVDGIVVSIIDGAPVPGVEVRLSRRQLNGNGFYSSSATSGATGEFSFPALPEGRLTLELRSERWFLPTTQMLDSPSANHIVEAHRAQWVDVQLVVPSGVAMPKEVQVTLKPVPGGRGALVPTAKPRRTYSDIEDGTLRFEGLRDGAYAFEVDAKGFAVTRSPQFELMRGGESANVTVALGVGATISGRIEPAVAGARIELRNADYDPSLSIHSTFPTPPIHGLRAASDAEGRFTVPLVPDGKYVVSVLAAGSPPLHVRDVEVMGGADINLGALELLLGGVIVGQVLGPDGLPREGATVLITNASHHSQGATDAQGVFRLDAVPPGTYEITATPGRANFWEALKYESREQVTVAPNEQSRITLTLRERERKG